MYNILCTGGCGFIGHNVLEYLTLKYQERMFINYDKLDYCSCLPENIKAKNHIFVKGDITDKKSILNTLNQYGITHVIHFAAHTHVDNSFGNSIDFTMTNVLGTHTLLECCKEYGKIQKFLHFSTDEVYGEVTLNAEGCTEKAFLNPTNPYAASKASAEMICMAYIKSFDSPIVVLRCNNAYGKGQYPEKLIPKFISLLHNNEKCTIHGDGMTRRNFIHTNDIASAVDVVFQKGGIGDTYNIGSCNEFNVLDVTKMLVNVMKPNEDLKDWIEHVNDRNFNDYRYAVDCEKLKELGWEESTDFQESLQKTIEWYTQLLDLKKKYWVKDGLYKLE